MGHVIAITMLPKNVRRETIGSTPKVQTETHPSTDSAKWSATVPCGKFTDADTAPALVPTRGCTTPS